MDFEDHVQRWLGRITWRGVKWAGKAAAWGLAGGAINWTVHTYLTDSHVGNATVVAILSGIAAGVKLKG